MSLVCSKEQLKSSATESFNDLPHLRGYLIINMYFFLHLNNPIYFMESRDIYQSAGKMILAVYKESRSYMIPSI